VHVGCAAAFGQRITGHIGNVGDVSNVGDVGDVGDVSNVGDALPFGTTHPTLGRLFKA
jgi:hypothetical protein